MDTKIPASFWLNETIEPLDAEVKLAILWLKTAHVTHCGWVSATTRRFVFETACPPDALQKAVDALGMGIKSFPNGYWLRDYIREQIGDGEALIKNTMAKSVIKSMLKLSSEVSAAILSEYPSLSHVHGMGMQCPSGAQERRGEERRGAEQSRGSEEGGQNGTSTPVNPDRESDPAKKEGAALDVDPLDLAEYLAAIEKYNKGNSDGLVIPAAFVRHWHNLRVSTAWHKTGSETPIPNDSRARLGDLKVLARAYQQRGELADFATPPAAAKKGKGQTESVPCPTADWLTFARETIGWSLPPDSPLRWEDLTAEHHKEFVRNWECQQRKNNQPAQSAA